jgi:hypothetical protein
VNDELRDAHGFSELERRNRARREAFDEYKRSQSSADAEILEGDDTELALADTDAEALAVDVQERERPLDETTWRTLQRIVDEPPTRPALPIAQEQEVAPDAEPSVTVADVISLADWADIRAIYDREVRRTPFA